jgi:hypothetical protein
LQSPPWVTFPPIPSAEQRVPPVAPTTFAEQNKAFECAATRGTVPLQPTELLSTWRLPAPPRVCSVPRLPQPLLRSKTKHSSAQQREAAVRYKTCKKLLLPFGPHSIASCGCAAPVEDNRGHPDNYVYHRLPQPVEYCAAIQLNLRSNKRHRYRVEHTKPWKIDVRPEPTRPRPKPIRVITARLCPALNPQPFNRHHPSLCPPPGATLQSTSKRHVPRLPE